MWAGKSPTPFVVCGIVAILCLFVGICIPILLSSILQKNMKESAILSRSNYDIWSSIPGPNNFQMKKQVTFYNLEEMKDDQVKLRTGSRLNYTIDRNISWTELVDSHAAIQFNYREHNIADQSTEEEEMKLVHTVNIGALAEWYQLNHKDDYKKLVPIVSNLIIHMGQNLRSTLIARLMHEYYINDFNKVRHIVLAKVENDTTAKRIYEDPTYGMGNWETLREWITPTEIKLPRRHPKYTELQDYFNLNQTEIGAIYGANSMLMKLITFGNHMLKTKHSCKARECTGDELAFIQLTSQNVTMKQLLNHSIHPPIKSYKDFYTVLPVPPEIPEFREKGQLTEKEKKVLFFNNFTTRIFQLDFANSKTSILNPVNGEKFMRQIETNAPFSELSYKYAIKEEKYEFYTFLYKYLKYLINNFDDYQLLNGTQKESAFSKMILFAAKKSLDHISNNIQHTLYARLLMHKFLQEKLTCEKVFNASSINDTKIVKICKDEVFNLKSLESFELWTLMGNQVNNGTPIIQAKFGLNDREMHNITNPLKIGNLGYYMNAVKTNASRYFKCKNQIECTLGELVALQWGSSGVTKSISGLVPCNSSESLQDWLPASDLEPQEYYIFANKHKNVSEEILLDIKTAKRLIETALSNQFEVIKLAIIVKDSNKLETEYGIKHGHLLYAYIRHIIQENLFAGAFRNRTARELAWGFSDQFLTDMRVLSYSRNGDPGFKNQLNIAPLNVTINESADVPLNEICTGQRSTLKIRDYDRYKGSPDLMVWEDFFSGQAVIQHYRKPYANNVRVGGTDGYQFGAGLTKESVIKFFDDFSLRTVKFDYKSSALHGNVEVFTYKINTKSFTQPDVFPDNAGCPMMNISSVYMTPLFVALPNYFGCKSAKMLENVTVDGKPLGADNVDMYFEVEPLTGITTGIKYGYEVAVYIEDNTALPSLTQKLIPLLRVEISGHYTDNDLNERFKDLIAGMDLISFVRFFFLCLAGIALAASIITGILYKLKSKTRLAAEDIPIVNDSIIE